MRFFRSKKGIFLAALVVRLLAGWWLGHFAHPQSWEPETIANNLLAGKGFLYSEDPAFSYRAYLLPAYPVLCAAVYFLTHHNQLILLFLQALLSAAACLQVEAIGRLAFSRPGIAAGGAWLTALHPGLIFYSTLLHPLTLDLFSYLWVLWACLALWKEPKISTGIQLGLAAGLALLSRGTILFFILLSIGGFLWSALRRRTLKKGLPPAAIALAVMMLTVLPWLYRNAVLFGRFPVFITSANQSLWQGNNPLSEGTAHLPDGQMIINQLPKDVNEALIRRDEIGQSDFFREQALAFIRSDPMGALRLLLHKWAIFWWFAPTAGLYYPSAFNHGVRIYYLIIAVLALAGLGFQRRRLFSQPIVLLVLFLLSIAFFQSLYYVEGRHRWVVEPILLLFSSCGAFSLIGRVSNGDSSRTRKKTASSYSYLWRKAYGRPMGNESQSYHLEEIQKSLGLTVPRGTMLDAGCGEGVDLAGQGKRPGVKVVGVELSAGGCWASAQRTRGLAAAHVVQGDLSQLPFTSNAFDFVYSYGVLHHMASPSSGLRELVRAAKPGAWVALYLYEDFADRGPAWRALLALSNLPRHLTTRLPHRLLYALCLLASPIITLLFTVPFRLSQRIPFLERRTGRMPFRHASNPWDLSGDLYDRFATPIERRYSRSSAQTFLREAGLQGIRIANRRGWMVAGIKP